MLELLYFCTYIMSIQALYLSYFRNIKHSIIHCNARNMLIYGANGTGKTNILEAISLLSPGRGLRSAKYDEICYAHLSEHSGQWQVAATIAEWKIEMGYNASSAKREIHLSGSKIGAAELAGLHKILWITPQMDRIFASSNSEKRKFFDRLVYATNNSHAQTLTRYEALLKERLAVLHHSHDTALLEILEKQITSLGKIICQNRLLLIEQLEEALKHLPPGLPKITLKIAGYIEDNLADTTDIEDVVRTKLKQNRKIDKLAGKTTFAPHRSEFDALLLSSNLSAKACSTGQQKIILVSILLALVILIRKDSLVPIIFLLDEIFVHLDAATREALSGWLVYASNELSVQNWITATDETAYDNFAEIDGQKANIKDLIQQNQ